MNPDEQFQIIDDDQTILKEKISNLQNVIKNNSIEKQNIQKKYKTQLE